MLFDSATQSLFHVQSYFFNRPLVNLVAVLQQKKSFKRLENLSRWLVNCANDSELSFSGLSFEHFDDLERSCAI